MAVKKSKSSVSAKKITSKTKLSKQINKVKNNPGSESKVSNKIKKNELYTLEEIIYIKNSVIESSKNYNKIVSLIKNLHTVNDVLVKNEEIEINSNFLTVSRGLIHNLYQIFKHLISKRLFKIYKGIPEQEETVRKWLASKYESFQMELYSICSISFFSESIATIKLDILEILMKLIQDESKYLVPSLGESYFATARYRVFLLNFLKNGNENSINSDDGTFEDYLFLEFKESYFDKYWDLKFYFFNEFAQVIDEFGGSNIPEKIIFSKLVTLTKSAPMYDIDNKEEITDAPVWVENAPQNTMYSINTLRNNFEKSWITVLNFKSLSKSEYSAALSILHKRIIPFFGDAQKLMDFLTASYTLGIKTKDILLSILALNGLWELMKAYNLEYPNFYTNLYAILTPDLLHLKEKSRFFRLLDLFMSSTHLSASIVASFIKRLARLCLTAPPSGIVCVIPFIYNLIKKNGHSTCMLLIHSTTSNEEDALYEDPFDETETDPAKTEAIGSSIWELEAMNNHYHPNVSALVKIFSQHFNKYSYNMEDFLDWNYSKFLDVENKKRFKGELGIEFEKWNSLFGDEGYMNEYMY